MDLGVPGAFLGLNSGVFVCISTVLATSCKNNTRSVRGTSSFEVKTIDICISNSGGE